MKKLLTITVALTLCAGAAFADHIGIYADAGGTSCALTNLVVPPGNNALYVIHKFNGGSTASQFKVNDLSTLFATSQVTPYLSIGTWNTDLSLAYGGCVIGDHVLVTLNFLWFGTALTCQNTLEIVPAPTSPIPGAVALVDCAQPSGNLESATGGRAYVGAGSDNCVDPTGCDPSPVAETTWGGIKALYR
jgi:hypothetical protein